MVGPIFPPTERGNKYIVTMMDCATRCPEAAHLKDIEAETVANKYTRIVIPKKKF